MTLHPTPFSGFHTPGLWPIRRVTRAKFIDLLTNDKVLTPQETAVMLNPGTMLSDDEGPQPGWGESDVSFEI